MQEHMQEPPPTGQALPKEKYANRHNTKTASGFEASGQGPILSSPEFHIGLTLVHLEHAIVAADNQNNGILSAKLQRLQMRLDKLH